VIFLLFLWAVYLFFSNTTSSTVTTLAGSGQTGLKDGAETEASFNAPSGVAVDLSGEIYIADFGNGKLRKIDNAGMVITCDAIGSEPVPVNGFINMDVPLASDRNRSIQTLSLPDKPYGLALSPKGYLVTSLMSSNSVAVITPHGDTSLHFNFSGTIAMGEGEMPRLSQYQPAGVAVDKSGQLYIADPFNNVVHVWNAAHQMTVLAGSLGVTGATNGPDSFARFNQPQGVAVDADGNVYVADSGNQLIREITPVGSVTTLAGSGSRGNSDGFGADASFDDPVGIALDGKGNIYVADKGNNKIRKITPSGEVTTLAGDGSPGARNGKGAAASFNKPLGVAVDSAGNVYVADTHNNLIRKITQF
jgi:sugar lactone lactonase YvrE